jgi:hypothetical protein
MTTARPFTSTKVKISSRASVLLGGLIALVSCAVWAATAKGTEPASARAQITGIVQMAPGLKKQKIADTAALYVIARAAGETQGPPVAVKRLVPPFKFPVEFTLSSADVMMPDAKLEGSVALKVRLAQTGAATPVNKGDFSSSRTEEVKVGSGKKARLLLDVLESGTAKR